MRLSRLVLVVLSGCGLTGTQTNELSAPASYVYAACPGATGGEAFVCALGAIKSKNASCAQESDCVPVALRKIGCHVFCGEALVNSSAVEGYRTEVTTETELFCRSIGKADERATMCAALPARRAACVDARCQWIDD